MGKKSKENEKHTNRSALNGTKRRKKKSYFNYAQMSFFAHTITVTQTHSHTRTHGDRPIIQPTDRANRIARTYTQIGYRQTALGTSAAIADGTHIASMQCEEPMASSVSLILMVHIINVLNNHCSVGSLVVFSPSVLYRLWHQC